MSSLPLPWTKHLKGKEKEDFESLLRNSTRVLSRFRDLITEREADITRQETSLETYKDTGWPYLQAHLNGRKAELQELKKLLEFLKN